MPRVRAARSARTSAARAAFASRRRMAIPATTSSCTARDAGGRAAGSSSASARSAACDSPDQEQTPDLEIVAHVRRWRGRRAPRAPPAPRGAPSPASRGRARRARSRPRRRRTALAPPPRAVRRPARRCRRSGFARARSPSCAIAMPRSARAGASPRRATRFSAPSGSPAARARAAVAISASSRIPSHLSLPPVDVWRPIYLMTWGAGTLRVCEFIGSRHRWRTQDRPFAARQIASTPFLSQTLRDTRGREDDRRSRGKIAPAHGFPARLPRASRSARDGSRDRRHHRRASRAGGERVGRVPGGRRRVRPRSDRASRRARMARPPRRCRGRPPRAPRAVPGRPVAASGAGSCVHLRRRARGSPQNARK